MVMAIKNRPQAVKYGDLKSWRYAVLRCLYVCCPDFDIVLKQQSEIRLEVVNHLIDLFGIINCKVLNPVYPD